MDIHREPLHDFEAEPLRDSLKLKAVYDDDLGAYLRSLGLDPGGSLGPCKFCRDEVTVENLAALFPQSGSLKIVCDRRECLVGLQELIRDGVVKV